MVSRYHARMKRTPYRNAWVVALLAGCAALAACGSSNTLGELGAAQFNISNCGGVLGNIAGCDIKQRFAQSGKLDLNAYAKSDGRPLLLRSDLPNIIEVQTQGGAQGTLFAKGPGSAVITAYDSGGDVDRLRITVDEMARIYYSELSNANGEFKLMPTGDVDGTFALRQSVQQFTLIFAQLDGNGQRMIGRESFAFTLDPGLQLQSGKENPTVLQFDLQRPAMPGTYALTITAKSGPGRFKLLIGSQ